jgi:hypothetical protein
MIVVMSVVAVLPIANAQSLVGELALDRGVRYVSSAVIDPMHGFAYFGTGEMPARIVKIRLSDFSLVDALTLDTDVDEASSAVIDSSTGFAYARAY